MAGAITDYERGTGVQVWACSRCSYHPDYIDGTLSGVPSLFLSSYIVPPSAKQM